MFAAIVLLLAGLQLLAFGVMAAFDPVGLLSPLGFRLSTAEAITEARAFYGGAEIALGLLMSACALKAGWREAGLVLVAACFAGIGGVRAIAFIAERRNSFGRGEHPVVGTRCPGVEHCRLAERPGLERGELLLALGERGPRSGERDPRRFGLVNQSPVGRKLAGQCRALRPDPRHRALRGPGPAAHLDRLDAQDPDLGR